jgi:UPF0176 protein
MGPHHIAAFYRFFSLQDPAALRANLEPLGQSLGISGTLILAREGINGTLSGSEQDLPAFLAQLEGLSGSGPLTLRLSSAAFPPFKRLKIKIKPEIVTLRAGEVRPDQGSGIPVDPADWNELISDPGVLLLDTRNDFEVQMGAFRGAVNPGMDYFRDFPAWAARELDPAKHPRIAMYCTGGIRCEKASAYLLEQGFEAVYQLQGGILHYLERVPEPQSLWQGECFVFDERIAVDPSLQPSSQGHAPRPGREL